jgi:hypothetical protein
MSNGANRVSNQTSDVTDNRLQWNAKHVSTNIPDKRLRQADGVSNRCSSNIFIKFPTKISNGIPNTITNGLPTKAQGQ